MEITLQIEGRNAAVKLIDSLCVKSANGEPFAYHKLEKIRRYLRESTIAIANAYFAE